MASWDDVVPALRKRLQSESKTLARRLSAISLPSGDEARPTVLNPQNHHLPQLQPQSQPAHTKLKPQTRRARTSSSPKAPPPHPTRIPKARQMSIGTTSYHRQPPLSHSQENTPKAIQTPPTSSSRSTFDIPRSHPRGLGLLHESPPFPIDSVPSSSSAGIGLYSHRGLQHTKPQPEDDPPRASIDSEERPYEHWYRGEVSRNGGVGELRVGRRQEMLDIANYGHFIRSRKAGDANGVGPENGYLDLIQMRRTRPRAGSISGLTRKERDSLYLDEMDDGGWRGPAVAGLWAERVLDQDPPTDFDKDDEDDVEDDSRQEEEAIDENDEGMLTTTPRQRQDIPPNLDHDHQDEQEVDDFVLVNHNPAPDTPPYPYAYAYIPTEADVANLRSESMSSSSITNERWTPTAGPHQTQKIATHPTTGSPNPAMLPRPSSRQAPTSPLPPSRIPHPSTSSRRSSDSRSTHNSTSTSTPTPTPRAPPRSKSEPPTSAPTSTPPQGAPPPSSFGKRSTSPGSTSSPTPPPPTTTTKKGANANNSGSRTKVNLKPKAKPKSKSKSKPPPATKREDKSDKRTSIAMYPAVEGGEELADAIPSWIQPVTREGNWDDVVLPVVARKKGLEGYYENTSAHHLQLKNKRRQTEDVVAPAPGTFGYDQSKYRALQVGEFEAGGVGDEFMELDEFGMTKSPGLIAEVEAGAEEEEEEEDAQAQNQQEEERVVVIPSMNPGVVMKPMQVGIQGQVHLQTREERVRVSGEDGGDGGAGCCKCVVM